MKKVLPGILAVFLLLTVLPSIGISQCTNRYYIRDHEPWGTTSNPTALNNVFGAGNYTISNYSVNAATVFSSTTCFVYMEGSENNDTYLNNYLAANLTTIQNWVSNGGRLFINSSGWNISINAGFGSTQINYGSQYFSSTGSAVNASDPVFLGPYTPVGTSYSGNYFAHDHLTGTNLVPLMTGSASFGTTTILAYKFWGSGVVFFGGVTNPNFWAPSANSLNLWQNIFSYTTSPALQAINTGTISPTSYCPPQTISVPYTTNVSSNPGNIFTAQLSNASGSFASPVNIGTLASTTSGTISATIPGGTPAGTGYRIRVTGSNPSVTGTTNGANITITAASTWYLDADNDGYYTATQTACISPGAGWTTTVPSGGSGDCAPADNTMNASFPFYADADGDGYGAGISSSQCAVNATTPPVGYSVNNTDCAPADNTMHASFSFYTDTDGDGYGTGSLVNNICAVNAATPPAGYSVNNTDCLPTDNTKWQTAVLYIDADNDNYDNGTALVCYGATIPTGYKATTSGTDCNDADNSIQIGYPFYTDADGDGYGTGSLITACAVNATTPPAGYSVNNTDCDDNNPAYYQPSPVTVSIAVYNGTTTVCAGAPVTFTAAPVNGGTSPAYKWYLNNTLVQNGSSASYPSSSVSTNDQLYCELTSNSACSSNPTTNSNTLTMTVINPAAAPTTPVAITGPLVVCASGTYSYSTAPVADATQYFWYFPQGTLFVSGQGTTNVTVTYPANLVGGAVKVEARNCRGISALRVVTLTMLPKPASPGVVSGETKVCPGIYTYSFPAVNNATSYIWTAPANATILSGQGTTSVSVQFTAAYTTGVLKVAATNCKGTSADRSVTISAYTALATPSVITGQSTAVCTNTTGLVYSIGAVAGATGYSWTVTGGTITAGLNTTSITVDFPSTFTTASVSVKATNACVQSAVKTLSITQKPAIPVSIAGPASACVSTPNIYTTAGVAGATGYNWTLPAGWNIISGGGTNSITATAGNLGGAVKVAAVNTCGSSAVKSMTVTINLGCRTFTPSGDDEESDLYTEEETGLPQVKVYPNPFTDRFMLEFTSAVNEEALVTLYDIAGRLTFQKTIGIQQGNNRIEINSDNQTSGIYTLSLQLGHTTSRMRVIKN